MAELPQPGAESAGYRLVSVPGDSEPGTSRLDADAGAEPGAVADGNPVELSHEGQRFRGPAASGGRPPAWPSWPPGAGRTGAPTAPPPEAPEARSGWGTPAPVAEPDPRDSGGGWGTAEPEDGWVLPEAGVGWGTPEPEIEWDAAGGVAWEVPEAGGAWAAAEERDTREARRPWETPDPWDVPGDAGPPGGNGERGNRQGWRRWGWIAAIAALALVAGGVVALTLPRSGGSPAPAAAGGTGRVATPSAGMPVSVNSSAPAMSTPSMRASAPRTTRAAMPASAMASATASSSMAMIGSSPDCTPEQQGSGHQGPTTLTAVLADAGKCSVPRGFLPQRRCQPQAAVTGSQVVICTAPIPQLAKVSFYTYSSLAALYAAYTNEVAELSGRSFKQDTGACGNTAVGYAEIGWNHQELHPREYTVAEMAAGKVPQLAAMGRMACFAVGKSQDIVWTTDVGTMLAVAQGAGAPESVYSWWAAMHHVIIFPGTDMCGMPGRMESVPLGNLVEDPVCPAGAGM